MLRIYLAGGRFVAGKNFAHCVDGIGEIGSRWAYASLGWIARIVCGRV